VKNFFSRTNVEEYALNVLESKTVIRIFTPKRKSERGENCIIIIFKFEFCTRQ